MSNVTAIGFESHVLIVDGGEFEGGRVECLSKIDGWSAPPMVCDGQSIARSDWDISGDIYRPYSDHVVPVSESAISAIAGAYRLDESFLFLQNFWFQQYESGDHHSWHTHGQTQFSCVWYVELPEGAPATEIRNGGFSFVPNVKQGDIMIFPSCFSHRSPPNSGSGRKTVVAFNI